MGIMKRKLEEKMEEQQEFFKPAEFADHPPAFEMFWKAYPRRKGVKVGKGAAVRLWHKLKSAEQCEALEAARNYARSDAAHRGYAKDADRFLKADYWRDWVEGPGEVSERDRLISELKRHVGKPYKSSYITTKGTDGLHSSRPWDDFSLQELIEMRDWLRG